MVSKLFCLMVALCSLQIVQPVSVEKRDLTNVPVLGPILAGAQGLLNEATQTFLNITSNAKEQFMNSTGLLGKLLKSAEDKIKKMLDNSVKFGKDSSNCVTARTESAGNITKAAQTSISNCFNELSKNATALLADIQSQVKNIFDLGVTTVKNQSECIWKGLSMFSCISSIASSAGSKGALDLSMAVSDINGLTTLSIRAPPIMQKCSIDAVTTATENTGKLISDIGDCIGNVAASS